MPKRDVGYQVFDRVERLDQSDLLKITLGSVPKETLYYYTMHEVLYDGVLKQTRTSPNWQGGVVTLACCKHLVRNYERAWQGVWFAANAGHKGGENALLYVGRISNVFESNYDLGRYLRFNDREAYEAKLADRDPRGDLYTPLRALQGEDIWRHENYHEPPNHTRSTEFYKKSPGSKSEREDGLIPKWWRDIEYEGLGGRRPMSFILDPCYVFSKPMLWSTKNPRRACLKLTAEVFCESLTSRP